MSTTGGILTDHATASRARADRARPERTGSSRRLVIALTGVVAAACLSACSKAPSTSKDDVLAAANAALAAERLVDAEKGFREVLRLDANDPTARRQLGILYLEQGQVLQAYQLLKQLAEQQPDDEIGLKLGLASLALRQISRARDELPQAREAAELVLDKKPGDETALLLLVDTAIEADTIKSIRKVIEERRSRDRDRSAYHLALGLLDLRQGAAAGAERELGKALELDPKSSAAHAALGAFQWSRNDLAAADKSLLTAAELAPVRSPLRLRYADFKLRTAAVPEAKAFLEGLTRSVPDYLPPRVYLMKLACEERQQDDCAARVQDVLTRDPSNYDGLLRDSLLSLAKGDPSKAIRELEYLSNVYRWDTQVKYQLAVAYLAFAGTASTVNALSAIDRAEGRLQEVLKIDPRFEPAVLLYAEVKIRRGEPAVVVDPLAQLVKERPQTARAHYLLASAYLAQQKGNDALAVYRRMMELFPKDPQPFFLAARILATQGQRPQARQELERAVAVAPDYLPAIEALVDLDLADKRYAAALERVQPQADKSPPPAQALAIRAKIHMAQQDVVRAEADLAKAIELEPNLEPAYLVLAQLYVSSGRQPLAIEMLNRFTETSKSVPALLQLAAIHERAGSYPAARDAYEKVLAVSADSVPALNNLAVLYSEHLGQIDKARELAGKARDAAPADPSVADTLGWILFKKADYARALPLLKDAAGKLADRPLVQFHLAMAHYMMGEEGAAVPLLRKAVEGTADFPGKDEARRRLAVLAIDGTKADAAARGALEEALREWPNDPAVSLRLAQLQARQGAADAATRMLEKVAADHPLYAPAMRQLALLYGERGADDAKAYELAQKARQAYPDDVEVTRALGILAYRRELYPRAAELLEAAGRTRKDDAELAYYLGAAHLQLKQWKDCKAALERAVSLKLPADLAEKAKQALADCSESASP